MELATVQDQLEVARAFATDIEGLASITADFTKVSIVFFVLAAIGQATVSDSLSIERALADVIEGQATVVDPLSIERGLAAILEAKAQLNEQLAIARTFGLEVHAEAIFLPVLHFLSVPARAIITSILLANANITWVTVPQGTITPEPVAFPAITEEPEATATITQTPVTTATISAEIPLMPLYVGDESIITCTVTDQNGNLVDPTLVTASVQTPDGNVTSQSVTRASTGVYTITYTWTQALINIVQFTGNAPYPFSQFQWFSVNVSPF